MAWYPDGVPDWCTMEELIEANYNIEKSYEPLVSVTALNESIKETTEEFYNRNYEILQEIIDATSK